MISIFGVQQVLIGKYSKRNGIHWKDSIRLTHEKVKYPYPIWEVAIMSGITATLGALFVIIGVISFRKGSIRVGGRFTGVQVTGRGLQFIAGSRLVVGAIALVIGGIDWLGLANLAAWSQNALLLILATYLITNLGLGSFYQARALRENLPQDGGDSRKEGSKENAAP